MKGHCQDYVCSNASSVEEFLGVQAAAQKPTVQPLSSTGGPLNIAQLGRHTWPLLHNLPKNYPQAPTAQDKEGVKKFMTIFAKVYPCIICRKDLEEDITKVPIQSDSREQLALWMSQQHNLVRKRLGQPIFEVDVKKLLE